MFVHLLTQFSELYYSFAQTRDFVNDVRLICCFAEEATECTEALRKGKDVPSPCSLCALWPIFPLVLSASQSPVGRRG